TTEAPTPEEEPEPEELPPTRDELKKMIASKEQEIKSMQTQYDIAQVTLQIEELQNETGEVLANFDGIVKTVSSEDEAAANGEPLIVISAADGYVVESQIGELALGNVHIGDTVSMYCYDTGMNYEGTITEISTFPSENGGYYSSRLETYYPMKIALADTGDISQNMYMEITLNSNSEDTTGGFYLSKAFIKQEATNYYVMKDVDGRLEKTYIKVANKQSGDAVLVVGGITMNDYIAFPYLDEAVEGTRTVQKSVDELYNY
ncbi:MAG: HlyD family efflux transporter periplasmic adaptor subunit, partial [Wujia sp.]